MVFCLWRLNIEIAKILKESDDSMSIKRRHKYLIDIRTFDTFFELP